MLIAVSCGVRETRTSSGILNTASLVTYFNEFINQNGGTALIIPPQERFNIDEIASRIDGIIITGGGDINPELYEEENTDSRNILDTRDSVEMKLLSIAEQNSIRTLAICRGHQMLNVYKGGNLIQDINKNINEPLSHTEINEKTSEHVHEIDLSVIKHDKRMNAALENLPGKKVVFTNSVTSYAEKVLERLGIAHHFQGIFDIVDADFIPKPEPLVYKYFVEQYRINPKNAVMVEDIARNLRPAADLGMKTVWVLTGRPWAHAEEEFTNPDFTIDNLSMWLSEVAEL